jgi:hypothetical protein
VATLALALQLNEQDSKLIDRCLKAVAEDRFDFGDDFHSVMGAWPEEVRWVADHWPTVAAERQNFMIVNNCLVNIWGYPHRRYDEIPDLIGGSCDDVRAALTRLRLAARGTFLPAN